MGMFDYVKVNQSLPDGWSSDELQSKDFDCTMTTVEITPEGRLMVEDFEYEEVPKAERPHPNGKGLLALMGSVRKINRRWRDLNFHGRFRFYGGGGGEDDWHEYEAKFTDGSLVEITSVAA